MSEIYDVEITAGAEADLRHIFEYLIAEGAANAASRLLDTLLARAAKLETFPRRGSIPDDLILPEAGEFRQLVEPPYRLIYEVEERRVLVHLIAHGRQDLRELLSRRLAWRDREET